MTRLLSYRIAPEPLPGCPDSDLATVGDFLSLSGCYGCYGCVALFAVMLVWPMTWSV